MSSNSSTDISSFPDQGAFSNRLYREAKFASKKRKTTIRNIHYASKQASGVTAEQRSVPAGLTYGLSATRENYRATHKLSDRSVKFDTCGTTGNLFVVVFDSKIVHLGPRDMEGRT